MREIYNMINEAIIKIVSIKIWQNKKKINKKYEMIVENIMTGDLPEQKKKTSDKSLLHNFLWQNIK